MGADSETSDAELQRAILGAAREFNAGRYFEAHEALEDGLDDVPDAFWSLFLGLIQIAVGYHKLASGFDGASRMLSIGVEKVAPYADDVLGIALGTLRERARQDLARLTSGGDAVTELRRDPPRLLPAH